jgi:hypothetical protein
MDPNFFSEGIKAILNINKDRDNSKAINRRRDKASMPWTEEIEISSCNL